VTPRAGLDIYIVFLDRTLKVVLNSKSLDQSRTERKVAAVASQHDVVSPGPRYGVVTNRALDEQNLAEFRIPIMFRDVGIQNRAANISLNHAIFPM